MGQLSRQNGSYCFSYTQGALASPRFKYLGRMRDLHQRYVSHELFPLFSNRVLSRSRPEYPDYVRWLAIEPDQQDDPMQLLARSGGRRATDELCVYPKPEVNADGEIELFFFSNGLRYLDQADLQRINSLKVGDRLSLRPEDDNVKDRFALRLETEEPVKVGYCPRYLNRDLRQVLSKVDIRLSVERVNIDAPIQYRLLCRAIFLHSAGIDLFASDEYLALDRITAAA
ncbi:HIRAN domain-containing protein [Methylomonas sp. MgM2]